MRCSPRSMPRSSGSTRAPGGSRSRRSGCSGPLQAFYSVRSERQLMEQIDYNLLFRWFVGLGIDDVVWDHSTFSKNRDRLLDADVAAKFVEAVLRHGRLQSDPDAEAARHGVTARTKIRRPTGIRHPENPSDPASRRIRFYRSTNFNGLLGKPPRGSRGVRKAIDVIE